MCYSQPHREWDGMEWGMQRVTIGRAQKGSSRVIGGEREQSGERGREGAVSSHDHNEGDLQFEYWDKISASR